MSSFSPRPHITKLTDEKALAMLREHREQGLTKFDLGKKYGCHWNWANQLLARARKIEERRAWVANRLKAATAEAEALSSRMDQTTLSAAGSVHDMAA